MTETTWPTKPKILTVSIFAGKKFQPLIWSPDLIVCDRPHYCSHSLFLLDVTLLSCDFEFHTTGWSIFFCFIDVGLRSYNLLWSMEHGGK